MANRDVIVIGASTGGVEALRTIFAALPGDLPASLFVVLHIAAASHSYLPDILGRAGPLPAVSGKDGIRFRRGCAYIAPPDRHMLIDGERLRIVRGPKENRHRPAIDPLFRSAAAALGRRVVAVVLTGNLDDGAAGLWAVKSSGGLAVVQDPADALAPGMPQAALGYADVDRCVPLREIAPLIAGLAHEPAGVEAPPAAPPHLEAELALTTLKPGTVDMTRSSREMAKYARPSAFSCPACRGTLWEIAEGDARRYRCHVGHAYSGESLLAAQSDEVEGALYAALRALEDRSAVSQRIAERYSGRLPELQADRLAEAKTLNEHAEVIRTLLAGGKAPA